MHSDDKNRDDNENVSFYLNQGVSHHLQRNKGPLIHVKSFLRKENNKLIMISPGRAESSLKYAEVIRELIDLEFDIIVLDHRGQGFSNRISSDPLLGHIESFDDYIKDFVYVGEEFKKRKKYKRNLLLAHSMGSLIGLGAAIEKKDLIDGAILASPMLRIKTKRLPEYFSYLALKILNLFGAGEKRAYGGSEYLLKEFEDNRVTQCSYRYHLNIWYEHLFPQIRLGAPSRKWLLEAMRTGRSVWTKSNEINIPLLLLQAGNDELVDNKRQDAFARKVPNCRIIRLKDAKHEIFQEVDAIRARAMVQVHKYIAEIGETNKSTLKPKKVLKKRSA